MDKSYKKPLLLITFGVVLFTALSNLGSVVQGLETCLNLLTPVLAGLLTAFVLSVPMRGLARILKRFLPKATDRQLDGISLLLTVVCVIAIVVLLGMIAVPQLAASVKSIALLIHDKWPDWASLLQGYGINTDGLSEYFGRLHRIGHCRCLHLPGDHLLCAHRLAGAAQPEPPGAVRLL